MSFRLILMRHAKSDWTIQVPTDHERPLNKRGRREAPRIGSRLVTLGWVPELILSSDATRTRETCQLVLQEFGPSPHLILLESLYHGGPREIANAILDTGHFCNPIMVVGHNPGWEEAVCCWSDQSIQMTTSNAALLEIEAIDWRAAMHSNHQWILRDVLRPKELES